MPINFPTGQTLNQLYTYDNKTWEWNGIYWEVYSGLTSYVSSITFNSYTGVTQPLIYSSITGGTYSGGTLYLVNNSGGPISITGFSTSTSGQITGATSVGTGLTIYDSTVDGQIRINSITGDNTNKVSTTLNSNTIELGINEQNLTLWDLVVQGNKLLNGSVSYVSGFTFSVSPLEYLINGVIYNITGQTSVTLSSGDSTFDRIDVIYANISGNTGVLQGIPSANPEKPLVDGDTEVEVTFVLVRANSSSADITSFVIYNENSGPPSEWTFGSGGVQPTRIISNFTGVTYSGGTSIRVSGVTGAYTTFFRLTGLTELNTNNYSTLQFAIRNLSANTTTSAIRFRFLTTGGTQNGSVVTMNGAGTANTVQYSPTNVSTWQLISIPLWRFYLTNTNVQVLEVAFSPAGTGAQSRYYFDLIEFIEGTSSAPPSNSWTTIQGDSAATTITAPSPNATLIISGGTNIASVISGTSTVVLNLDDRINLNGVTASTISATTYQNLPTDIRVTGATYSNNTFTYRNNTGGTFSVLFNTVTGLTVNGNLSVTGNTNVNNLSATTISAATYQNLPVSGITPGTNISVVNNNGNFTISFTGTTGSNFTGGTVSGSTNFTNGLSANTISATTYFNLPTDVRVTGGTYSNGNTTYTNNTGGTFTVTGSATYSSGILSGSSHWFSNGNGTVTLPKVQVALYNNSSYTEPLQVYTVTSGITGSGGITSLTDNDTNYIYIEYNNGSPRWAVTTNNSIINDSNNVLCYLMFREINNVNVFDFNNSGSGLPSKLNNRVLDTDRFSIESGFTLSLSSTTLVLSLSSGNVWCGINKKTLPNFTSNGIDSVFIVDYHNSGNWISDGSKEGINNVFYDNGTDIFSGTTSKFLVNWYYREQGRNVVHEVYGTQEYDNLAEAELALEPVNLPELITSQSFLVGRILIQVESTTGFVESVFTRSFHPSQVTQHNDLINLQGGDVGEYYHLSLSQYNDLTASTTPNTIYSSDDSLISDRTVILENYFIDFKSRGGNGFKYIIDRGSENFQVYQLGKDDPTFDVSTTNNTVTVNGGFIMNSPTGENYLFNIQTTPLDYTHKIVVNDPTFGFILGYDMSYISNAITGGSFSSDTLYLQNNSGATIEITGFTSGGGVFSGGTVNGSTVFTNGLSANTVSATTYQNLPTDIRTTGATYSNNRFTFTNNTGGTYSVLFNTVTGLTVNGNITVTGNTILQSGVTANTFTITGLTTQSSDTFLLTANSNGVLNRFGGSVANRIPYFNSSSAITTDSNFIYSGNTISLNNAATSQILLGNSGAGIYCNSAATTYLTFEVAAGQTGAPDLTKGFLFRNKTNNNYLLLDSPGANQNMATFYSTLIINNSAASTNFWGTSGIAFRTTSVTYADTSSSGTAGDLVANSFAIPNFISSSPTTYSGLSTVYIAGAPTKDVNVSGNTFALKVNSGNVLFNGGLTVTGTTTSPTYSGNTFLSTGTYGSVTMNAGNNLGMLVISGSGTVGGTGYTDFIKVTNTSAGATNTNKTIRVSNNGNLEVINSAYNATAFSIADNGIVTITGGPTVSSNSATTNALNIGSKGQLFDDGNFHIHGNSGSVWINSLDGGAIRLGTQTNSGNSPVIVDTTTVGHSFFTKAQSSFNASFGTETTMDNLKVRINGTGGSGGVIQAGAVSGTFNAYTTLLGNVAGSAVRGDTNSGGITFTTTYQNISGAQLTLAAGDTTTVHLIDTTNSRIYRITAIHCQGTTGGYISIERMS